MLSQRVASADSIGKNINTYTEKVTRSIAVDGKDLVNFLTILKADGVVNDAFVMDGPVHDISDSECVNAVSRKHVISEEDAGMSVLEFKYGKFSTTQFIYDVVLTNLYDYLKCLGNVNRFGLSTVSVHGVLYQYTDIDDVFKDGDRYLVDKPYFQVLYRIYMD